MLSAGWYVKMELNVLKLSFRLNCVKSYVTLIHPWGTEFPRMHGVSIWPFLRCHSATRRIQPRVRRLSAPRQITSSRVERSTPNRVISRGNCVKKKLNLDMKQVQTRFSFALHLQIGCSFILLLLLTWISAKETCLVVVDLSEAFDTTIMDHDKIS